MSELHFPWIEISILLPLVGAICIAPLSDSELTRKWCLVFSGLTLAAAVGAWLDFQFGQTAEAEDSGHLLPLVLGWQPFVIDRLSAPLLPLVALVYFLTRIATVRTKIRRFSFWSSLVSEAIVLATFSSKVPWVIVGLLAAGTVFPWLELRSRGQSSRVFGFYMGLFVGLMLVGQFAVTSAGPGTPPAWGVAVLAVAMLVRCGIIPLHCWVADLFERATFGTALLFVTPMVGAYGMMRLVVPVSSDSLLYGIGLMAIITALYASAMALIQRDARRFFSFLVLSNGALVMAGLLAMSHHALAGGLCVWLSVTSSLAGLGLTLRALEARRGRLCMKTFQGLYEHTPNLAMCFGLTALASVGFPGTFGFIGTELLVDGAVESHPYLGILLVVAAAMNGIAVIQAFFRLFGGAHYVSSVSLQIRMRERCAVLALAALILLGGMFPHPIVSSRSRAAEDILQARGAAPAVEHSASR